MTALLGGLQLGSFYLRYAWLGAFLGLLAVYALTPLLLRAAGVSVRSAGAVRDRHIAAFALFVLIWKFFAPLLDPAAIAARPLILFLSPPTSAGMAAGLAAAGIYLVYAEFRRPLLPPPAWFVYYACGAVAAVWVASPLVLLVGRSVPFAALTVSLRGAHYAPANLVETAALTPALWRIASAAFRNPAGRRLPEVPDPATDPADRLPLGSERDRRASPTGAKTGWEALFGLSAATLAASLFVVHPHTALGLSGLQWSALAAGALSARRLAAGSRPAPDRSASPTRP